MIALVPYNPQWQQLFAEEKSKIKYALGNIELRIEHIGSTAIPGIYAKPVIDILIGVPNINLFNSADIEKIEALGYRYNLIFESEFPNRRYFQKDDSLGNRTHQIHLVNYPSSWWEKHILFRDYLRKHHDEAKNYESLKLDLAKQHNDTLSYAVAKTEFCRSIDKKAFFDFEINKPAITTTRLNGYIPQQVCFEIYSNLFHDSDFIRCFGIELTDETIIKILDRDTSYWDHYGFGPLVWFDKLTDSFVGEGGLNHTTVENQEEIELTYSLSKNHWGKGLAVEIGQYAINYGFNSLSIDNIVCFTMTTNYQSLRVMEKLGFEYEKNFTHAKLPHKLYRLKNKYIGVM